MKKVLHFFISILVVSFMSACDDASSSKNGSNKENTGTLTGTVNGVSTRWTTNKTSNTSGDISTEENTASIERETDTIDVSITAIKDNEEEVLFADSVSFSFKFPVGAVTTGSYSGNISSTVDGALAFHNLHNNTQNPLVVQVTKVEDSADKMHIEGDIENVLTEGSGGKTFEISLHFSVDASERELNGEAVHSHF